MSAVPLHAPARTIPTLRRRISDIPSSDLRIHVSFPLSTSSATPIIPSARIDRVLQLLVRLHLRIYHQRLLDLCLPIRPERGEHGLTQGSLQKDVLDSRLFSASQALTSTHSSSAAGNHTTQAIIFHAAQESVWAQWVQATASVPSRNTSILLSTQGLRRYCMRCTSLRRPMAVCSVRGRVVVFLDIPQDPVETVTQECPQYGHASVAPAIFLSHLTCKESVTPSV